MHKIILTAGALCTGALGLASMAGSAHALPWYPGAKQAPSLSILAMDQEDLSVEEDLVPDEVPESEKEGGETPVAMPPRKEPATGDLEDEMIDKVGPGAE